MAELTIEKTYGAALYQAAKELGKVEIIAKEAAELVAVFESESELAKFIDAPTISASEKKKALEKIFRGKICDELLNFLFVLCDKGRASHFKKMIVVFKEEMDREEGFAYGTVYSVESLSASQIEKLEEQVKKLLKQNVRLENEIDKTLIGGVKIMVDGKMIDASLKGRMKDLELAIN